MDEMKLAGTQLQPLVDAFLKAGYIVVSEGPDGTGYRAVKSADEVALNPGTKPGKSSFKQFLFPKSEPIFHYKKEINDIELADPPGIDKRYVILGARPCDAKSTAVLAKVFNWDYKDDFFNKREANTVTIGMACAYSDEHCFCTSVGLSPTSDSGSDLFLVPLGDGGFGVRILTDKGKQFIEPFMQSLSKGDAAASDAALAGIAAPKPKFNHEQVRKWIEGNFENPFWASQGETCVGCAQCAFVCPVCHCFDIVDEDNTYLQGRRMKNWDACQFGLFTKHASGHNPRGDQNARYRQRVSHKFAYYPERFGEILCTGCGRCSRGCAVGMDIGEIVSRIDALAK
jgi:ferredoxin